jgi:hypothetical protein
MGVCVVDPVNTLLPCTLAESDASTIAAREANGSSAIAASPTQRHALDPYDHGTPSTASNDGDSDRDDVISIYLDDEHAEGLNRMSMAVTHLQNYLMSAGVDQGAVAFELDVDEEEGDDEVAGKYEPHPPRPARLLKEPWAVRTALAAMLAGSHELALFLEGLHINLNSWDHVSARVCGRGGGGGGGGGRATKLGN